MKASGYGIANLKRILPNIPQWAFEQGGDYSQVQELYNQVLVQWQRYMGHVATIVGGVEQTRKAQDQDGPVYAIVPRARQREAVRFLAAEAFTTPTWMLDRNILSRIEHAGAVDRLRARQVAVLNNLLEPRRMQRLIESQAAIGAGRVHPGRAVRRRAPGGVERTRGTRGPIDGYRRNLQRGYLDRLQFLMTQELPPIPPEFARFITVTSVNVGQSDIRAFARGDLEAIKREAARGGAEHRPGHHAPPARCGGTGGRDPGSKELSGGVGSGRTANDADDTDASPAGCCWHDSRRTSCPRESPVSN